MKNKIFSKMAATTLAACCVLGTMSSTAHAYSLCQFGCQAQLTGNLAIATVGAANCALEAVNPGVCQNQFTNDTRNAYNTYQNCLSVCNNG